MQTDQLEHLREKLRMAQDETRSMQAKNEVLERFVEVRLKPVKQSLSQ